VVRRHLVTKGSFYERLADHGHEIVSDEDFAHLYSERMAARRSRRRSWCGPMLCATHDKTSDAETSRRTRVDADWKAAMGVDDDFCGIGATTFSLMRARMVLHDADNELFRKTIEKGVEKGVLRGKLTAIMVAKVPPVTNSGRFPKTDFTLDLAAGTATCPAGNVTSDARPATNRKGRPVTRFVFAPATCAACPCASSARPPTPAARWWPAPTRTASPGPGRPGGARDQGAAAPAGQGRAQDRPPRGSRHAQVPLPGADERHACKRCGTSPIS
jgi:hypothetical protein